MLVRLSRIPERPIPRPEGSARSGLLPHGRLDGQGRLMRRRRGEEPRVAIVTCIERTNHQRIRQLEEEAILKKASQLFGEDRPRPKGFTR
jgi:hypothetical protein